jgi:hypothetical protein
MIELKTPKGEIDTCRFDQVPLLLAAGWGWPDPKPRLATTDDTATMKDGIDPVNNWPKGALKQLLDELHIAYPADASITDLANLVPGTHQHHIKDEAPAHTWGNARVVTWLKKEGANVPEELKDNTDALFEMVNDVIKLKAGQPLD